MIMGIINAICPKLPMIMESITAAATLRPLASQQLHLPRTTGHKNSYFMIMARTGQIAPETGHDHGIGYRGSRADSHFRPISHICPAPQGA
jgi:hypothetical protein